MARILIVDDQPAIRQGLRIQIGTEPGLAVVGEAGTGREGLSLAETLRPDVAIVDVEMPGLDGIAITERLLRIVPGCAVVILTIHDDDETRRRALKAGARAFVVKGTAEALRSALLSVAGATP